MFRTNQKNPKGFQDKYLFNLLKYYKIWVSADPREFLGFENQLRLVRMRKANQKIEKTKIEFYFIYSSSSLNDGAKTQLQRFCSQYDIIPIDFDKDLPPLLEAEEDKELYAIGQEELRRAQANQFGNLAAVSDCTRLLVPVIERYGIYSDFDVQVALASLGVEFVSVRAPVLLNAEMVMVREGWRFRLILILLLFHVRKKMRPNYQKKLCKRFEMSREGLFKNIKRHLRIHHSYVSIRN